MIAGSRNTARADGAGTALASRAPRGSLGIVALGQAGIALRTEEELVLIDPFLSERPERLVGPLLDPRDLRDVTAVLATHEHGDHLDLPVWTILAQVSPAARFVVPEALVPLVVGAGIPVRRVTGVRVGVPVEVGSARVTAVPACHGVEVADGYGLGDLASPRWVGYAVALAGVRIYHAGDSLAAEATLDAVRRHGADIAFLPINGRDPEREARGIVGNMTPDEAARLAAALEVSLAIPIHFDTIRGNVGSPEAFVAAMRRDAPTAAVWVPIAGAGILWPAGPGA